MPCLSAVTVCLERKIISFQAYTSNVYEASPRKQHSVIKYPTTQKKWIQMDNPSVYAAPKTSGQATCAKQTARCQCRHLTCNNLREVSRACVRPIHSIIRWREMFNIPIN